MSTTKMVFMEHACGGGCGCGRNRKRTPAASAEQIRAAVGAGVRTAMERVRRAPTLIEQVAAELKKPGNERVIAAVNEATGQVTTCIVPAPPKAANLSAGKASALEAERKRLLQGLRNLPQHERVKAMTRINVIEDTLRTGRSVDESNRRHQERDAERDRQRYGIA